MKKKTPTIKTQKNRPRLQWNDYDGFCGSQAVQSIGLENGTYISQLLCRKFISEKTGKSIKNAWCLVYPRYEITPGIHTLLDYLHISYELYDTYNKPIPQSKNYINWLKKHINSNHLVISGLFMRNGGLHDEYDHIVVITDIKNNQFILNDFLKTIPHEMQQMDDLKWNEGNMSIINGKKCADLCSQHAFGNFNNCSLKYKYYIPYNECFGCAIIPKDINIHIILIDNFKEPNIIKKDKSIIYKAKLIIKNVKIGKLYEIEKRTQYNIDKLNNFKSFKKFKAKNNIYLTNILIKSNSLTQFKIKEIEKNKFKKK